MKGLKLLSIASLCGASACISQVPLGPPPVATTLPASTVASPVASATGKLYVKITFNWDGTGGPQSWPLDTPNYYCEIPSYMSGTPAAPLSFDCSSMPGGPGLLSVPEGTLHGSVMTFTVGTAATSECKTIDFYPYTYKASNSNAFINEWNSPTTPTDCTANPIPADCYFGWGKDIIPTFPYATAAGFGIGNGMALLTDINVEYTFKTTTSGWRSAYATNRYLASDYATTGLALAADPGPTYVQYVINSLTQNRVVCRDDHHEKLYELFIPIHSDKGFSSQFKAWPN